MTKSHEIMFDLEHLKAIFSEEACKRYEFHGKYGPVIGITGIGGGWHKKVRDYIIANNIGGVLTYFGLLTKGVDAYLPLLHKEIIRYPNALILGFSAGGIIALRYAQKYGWNGFRKIFTIATPFAGIPKNLSPLGKTCRELSMEDAFLKEIVKINPPPNKVFSFLSADDRYSKRPTEILSGLGWPGAVLDGKGHGSLQSSWEVIGPIIKCVFP